MNAGTPRLGLAEVPRLPAQNRPAVLPGEVAAGVLHFGLGAFHRAHQAVYTERAIAAAGGDWGIVAVAPRSRAVLDPLAEQDHLFSVTTLDPDRPRTEVIGGICASIHAASDPAAVVRRLADPAIRVVTLTVTEKAYRIDAGTAAGADPADGDPDRPARSVAELLVRGLAARAGADAGPIALVSCDNLIANGSKLRELVQRCAPPRLRDWLAVNATFPATMVDRIVPASTPRTLEAARCALGVHDLAAVSAEPFSQWVVEDDFPGGRPAWDAAGVQLTTDVAPWEQLKLRVVNGLHSTLAYLGALAGCETISAAMALPGMRALLDRFLTEDILPSLDPPVSVDPAQYAEQALTRFANPALPHRTLQVAMDGSQKLPQRMLQTALDRRRGGDEPRATAFAVAAWLRFLHGRADDGRSLPLDDPLADQLRQALAAAGEAPASVVDAVVGLDGVFPAELAADGVFRRLLADELDALARHGVRAVLTGAGAGVAP